MKISNRLKIIASFVDDNSNIFDVGCDHALLDIFLVLNKKNVKAIASDINPGPLERAKENIKFYQVEDLVEVNLGDGIKDIDNDVDTIIISGLGGETIIDILKKDESNLNNIKTLILSPHSDEKEVRKFLSSINFKIEDEKLIYDLNKPYTIIKFVKGKEEYNELELLYGPILLKNKDENFYKYYEENLDNLKRIIKNIPKENTDTYKKIEEEIERLDKILKV